MPSLVKINPETREELADKHFQCPRMPGSVLTQIIVRIFAGLNFREFAIFSDLDTCRWHFSA